MSIWRLGALASLPLLLAACAASGPKFAEVETGFPAQRPGEGRIFFYRQTGMGAAVQPEIKLNGQPVGAPEPSSFFFVDRPAGKYTASARTEVESTVDFDLHAGEPTYVRMDMTMGLFVGHPQLSVRPPAEAAAALRQLAYIGAVPVASGRLAAPPAAGTPAPAPAPARQSAPAAGVTLDDLRGLLPPKQ
jgi:hypothetical protein